MYVRIKANPEHYRGVVPTIFDMAEEDGEDAGNLACVPAHKPVNSETRLEEMVADAIKQLKDEGLVEDTGDEFDTTDYGDMLCQYSIRFPTFLSLKNMDPGATAPQLVSLERFCFSRKGADEPRPLGSSRRCARPPSSRT